ncbi:MAG: hypothetical protein SWQ30_18470 [Thermodesulfobacteriota bacterium]|nr:hypothetical protein [Thermodesulfobacteriota bacterium]
MGKFAPLGLMDGLAKRTPDDMFDSRYGAASKKGLSRASVALFKAAAAGRWETMFSLTPSAIGTNVPQSIRKPPSL